MPKNVKVKVPGRSGFDKSFQNILTSKVGTLVPILVDEVIPNSKVHLDSVIAAKLPPLASDTFMRCNLKVEAFFVPTRLLYGGFEAWLCREEIMNPASPTVSKVPALPILQVVSDDSLIGSGTLSDYLGLRLPSVAGSAANGNINIFPFLAYHKCYSDWYRNAKLQRDPFFKPLGDDVGMQVPKLYSLPYQSLSNSTSYRLETTFADGVALGALRQRNFGLDYFTCAMAKPQQGNAQRVTIETSGGTSSFTIAALRAANSLQQFAERNELAGPRLQDYVKAHYGADLSSGVAQRTILLGSGEIVAYTKGIYQTANNDVVNNNNPFSKSVAAQYGSVECSGKLNLIQDFTAQEPGYIMVMASLVPRVTYNSGVSRMLLRYNAQNSQTDMATPLLQNVGNQPIYQKELTGKLADSNVFGYIDRYGDFKARYDELHGLMRDGESLESFALQRSFAYDSTPVIGNDFLQIPTDYLDQVAAVSGEVSQYGVWMDVYHNYKVSMPLDVFVIPSLQDPAYEHGRTLDIPVYGSRLD